MHVSILASHILLISTGICANFNGQNLPDFSGDEAGTAPQDVLDPLDADCTISHATRYTMARRRDPVHFDTSPLHDFELPKIEPMNATAGEQWEFDGISSDGRQAFIFGFYRDPNYSFLGTGNLRAYMEFALANGSRYAVVDYAEESTIISCLGRGTRGTWSGKEFLYEFQVAEDMSSVRLRIDTPEAKGMIVMQSVAPPRYADNTVWPSDNASSMTVPHFYWAEPIPVADTIVEMAIEGSDVKWTGMGGHERLWGAFNWPTCLANLLAVRLHVGPYALSFIEFGSDREKGQQVPSVLLVENGQQLVGTRRTEPSTTEDFVRVRMLYGGDGATTEYLLNKVTGVEVIVESPTREKTWSFLATHKNIAFEYVLTEGVGGTAYSGIAKGGLVGSKTWEGPAFTEIMRFPEKSWLLTKNFVY